MKDIQDAKSAKFAKTIGRAHFRCVAIFGRSKSDECFARSPGDQRENKMQQSDVGVGALFPAHENPTKTVHPAMRSLDYPAASLVSSVALELVCVLTPARDVACETELLNSVSTSR